MPARKEADSRRQRRLAARYAGLILALSVCGCPPKNGTGLRGGAKPVGGLEVRDIRVLLTSSGNRLRFQVSGPYEVRAAGAAGGASSTHAQPTGWVAVAVEGGGLRVGRRRIGSGPVQIVPAGRAILELSFHRQGKWTPAAGYGGRLTLRVTSKGRLSAINVVDLDTYIAGVLGRELYPDFHREAFRAQAVAARTYAMFEMARHARRAYDVTATEASQVYGGLARGRAAAKAIEAAHHTRGIVATWSAPGGERIFCTYYSSACGGRSQDAADCKPVASIPPLAGGVRCDYCRIAKGEAYRWKPVRLAKSTVQKRLFARYPQVGTRLRSLAKVEVASRTHTGRPGKIRLVGTNNRTHELVAEDFRLAVGSRSMRSTDCRIQDQGEYILLTDGRGFGHGMGLCQWGMQGQALQGRSAGQILKFYYPGMHLTRAY
ncbi:MAG: SpoIID/LytB domain-containing protein [Planctomycetes bacterium]|nr:SpoIID/LytB domain-containing protein [Planctomycetota bacterium]